MCGIAGIAGDKNLELIRAMATVQSHRGPDGEGFYFDKGVALGHQRLSIIDLETGQQPMTTADRRYTVVFNGEIYNYREVRRQLEGEGAKFRTRSDTEVLLEAYAAWNRTALDKLRGMFAFAIWDRRERRLFAARDRLGVKPLYFARVGNELVFGSEIKALLVHGGVRRELDEAALDDFLTYLYVPAPRTIFQAIHELPPAHWLEWQEGKLRVECYWDIHFDPESRPLAEQVEEFGEMLSEAVGIRLVSDVPLGLFLSGGLDSGTIAALMARQSAEPVRAFTLGFEEGGGYYSEWMHARAVTAAIGAEAKEMVIRPPSADLLPAIVRHFDEPFGNPTALLVYQLSQAGRRHVTVTLAGDGGDEVLLGYPRYQGVLWSRRYGRVPELLRRCAAMGASHLPEAGNGNHTTRRLREFLTASVLPPERMYFEWICYFGRELRQRLYSPEMRGRLLDYDSSEFLMKLFRQSRANDLMDQINYVDLHSFLPYNLLRYSDRMSMAHGLEIRCPFTDHKLVEYLARVPWSYKLRHGVSKFLLRQAAKRWLPTRVLRRGKLGLNPPMGIWLRGRLRPLLEEYLGKERIRTRGYFQPHVVEELKQDHLRGRRDYSLHLWALMCFEEWQRQYLDAKPVAPCEAGSTKMQNCVAGRPL